MRQLVILSTVTLTWLGLAAHAQTNSMSRSDAKEFLPVRQLPCSRIEGDFIQYSSLITTYAGLARIGTLDHVQSNGFEAEIFDYCKTHAKQSLIDAIGVVFHKATADVEVKITK
jgi:hypothetical protein